MSDVGCQSVLYDSPGTGNYEKMEINCLLSFGFRFWDWDCIQVSNSGFLRLLRVLPFRFWFLVYLDSSGSVSIYDYDAAPPGRNYNYADI
jgi:hypothetical protein